MIPVPLLAWKFRPHTLKRSCRNPNRKHLERQRKQTLAGLSNAEMAEARSANREVADNRFFSGLPLTPPITFPIGSTTGAMKQLRNTVIRAGLGALYFSGAYVLLRPIFSGVGAVFMLHHVRPGRADAFQPNRHLEVTPGFLRATLEHLKAHDHNTLDGQNGTITLDGAADY